MSEVIEKKKTEEKSAKEKFFENLEIMLDVSNIEVVYNEVILVLKGLSLQVPKGKIMTLLGSNGAGKSTTLKAISGLLISEDGEVTDGKITFEGELINNSYAEDIVQKGIFQVMEGRRIFKELTVDENLVAGSYIRKDKENLKADKDHVYELFPALKRRMNMRAGYLSGGEQQMLAIGRALMAKPKLLLLDEPSLGLSPLLVKEIFETIVQINKEGTTILLVEQNANMALKIADYGYIMENGKVVLDGPADVLRNNDDVKEFYLGMSEVGSKKSYKNVKHYRRRKRWLS
jgi:branched-chain amino acid transport system ATP-binding protein